MPISRSLPIAKHKSEIINAVKNNQVVIIEGRTGCGKSTQVPQYLHECRKEIKLNKRDIIACLHPRTIAAINLAERVANETRSELGNLVGYRVRFYSRCSSHTKILYMTAGCMVKLLSCNKGVGRYRAVIIDEAHERSIIHDIVMGQMKQLVASDSSLKLVIMSATLNVDEIEKYYPGAVTIRVSSPDDNVEVIYWPVKNNHYIKEIIATLSIILGEKNKGHILVFLPSESKVRQCRNAIKHSKKIASYLNGIKIYKLFSAMDKEAKMQVFAYKKRKIIVATNIAENSITIEDVNFVIDSGFVQRVFYHHPLRLENWVTCRISKAEADQRKGRTGRTGPGKCYRLFAEQDIEPAKELLVMLNNMQYIAELSDTEKHDIVRKIESELTVDQMKVIITKLPFLNRKIGSPAGIISTLKTLLLSREENIEFRQSLNTIGYFEQLDMASQDKLVDQMITSFSPAQINCLVKSNSLADGSIETDKTLFESLEKKFESEGFANNSITKLKFSKYPQPEIKYADLGSTVLLMKTMGYEDMMSFPFIVSPKSEDVTFSVQHLNDLSLLNDDKTLTRLGTSVSSLPMKPPLGKVAIVGSQLSSRRHIFIMLAMLSVRHIYKKKHLQFDSCHGDLFQLLNTYLEAYDNYFDKGWCKANDVFHSNLQYAHLVVLQLEELLPSPYRYIYSYLTSVDEIKTVFLCGFFQNLAVRQKRKSGDAHTEFMAAKKVMSN